MRRWSYLLRTADLHIKYALQDLWLRLVCGFKGCTWLLERGMPTYCGRCGRDHPIAARRAANERSCDLWLRERGLTSTQEAMVTVEVEVPVTALV